MLFLPIDIGNLFLERYLDWVLLMFNVPGLFLFVGVHTVCFANDMFVLTVIFEYLRAEQAGKSKDFQAHSARVLKVRGQTLKIFE